jgi:uncharacterized OB-fold protein
MKLNGYLKLAVDKVISSEYIINSDFMHDSIINDINSKIDLLQSTTTNLDINISLKILRYMFVRTTKLIPYSNIHNQFGYTYPIIDHIFDKSDYVIYDVFEYLDSKKLLIKTFFEKSHYCPNCSSAFINFKETCTQCGSSNITHNYLIHHFVCANVAQEQNYVRNDKLICPKCDKELKHIGVDYDKPSVVYNCNECTHVFQEPDVMCTCFNCHNTYSVDNLKLKTIYSYELSSLADSSAIHGIDNLFMDILKDDIDIVPLSVFKKFTDIEIKRIERYNKSKSTFVLFKISGIDELYSKSNDFETVKNMFKELSSIIKNFLRTTDLITSFNDVSFGFLMIETDINGVSIAISRLKIEIDKLIKKNFEDEYITEYSVLQLENDTNIDDLFNKINLKT